MLWVVPSLNTSSIGTKVGVQTDIRQSRGHLQGLPDGIGAEGDRLDRQFYCYPMRSRRVSMNHVP